jgi:hypothetical protein
MNFKYITFSALADKQILNINDKAAIITASVAFAISNQLQLPTSEVEDYASHFNLQLQPTIYPLVSEWNENVIMDAKVCIEQIRMFWTIRYLAAHPEARPMYSFKGDFFETAFSVNTFVSDELMTLLNCNKEQIITLSTVAKEVMTTKE